MPTTDQPARAGAPPRAFSEDEAWAAVLGRDRGFDGAFIYAVRTTGVYCRPSCPSRRPRRENVVFLRTAEAAEREGFRACHRCHPGSTAGTPAERRIRLALEYIDAHVDEPIALATLARKVGLSPFHLQRTFKQRIGLSPRAYQNAKRLERFKARLQVGDIVSKATYEAGFGSSRGAYEQAGAGLGMTPGAYRRGGSGLRIRFTTVRSGLGRVLVGATERGVCAVALGGDESGLEAELRREFPNALIERDDSAVREWVDPIVRHLEGAHPGLAVPLDLQGTAFQLRVWKALQEIPPGETRSYGEVAAAIGRPSAARAVARACASNRAALVVPCHRVVREGGALGGYRWGSDRKRRLLEREAETAARSAAVSGAHEAYAGPAATASGSATRPGS